MKNAKTLGRKLGDAWTEMKESGLIPLHVRCAMMPVLLASALVPSFGAELVDRLGFYAGGLAEIEEMTGES